VSEIKVSFVRTTYIIDVLIFINNKKVEPSLFACSASNVFQAFLLFCTLNIFIKFVTRLTHKNDPFH